jgi:hypothetical protein
LRWIRSHPYRDLRTERTGQAGKSIGATSEGAAGAHVVLCAGMPRSGSTWSYNVCRLLLEHCYGPDRVTSGYFEGRGADEQIAAAAWLRTELLEETNQPTNSTKSRSFGQGTAKVDSSLNAKLLVDQTALPHHVADRARK